MPVLMIIVGVVLVVTAIRGTTASLAGHLRQDVSGSFLIWIVAILLIGGLGYIPGAEKPARLLLALVVAVLLLKDGTGFISSFVQQIENAPAAAPPQPAGGNANLPNIPVSDSSNSSTSGSGGGGGIGGMGSSFITGGAAGGGGIGGAAGGIAGGSGGADLALLALA